MLGCLRKHFMTILTKGSTCLKCFVWSLCLLSLCSRENVHFRQLEVCPEPEMLNRMLFHDAIFGSYLNLYSNV